MKNKKEQLIRFQSISESHKAFGLPKPNHPLISLVHFNEDYPFRPEMAPVYDILDFYKITFITKNSGKLKYGQSYYDFNEGSMMFIAPNQLVGSTEYNKNTYAYILLIHPDFLLGHSLGQKIKKFNYFTYAINEALHLSEIEKQTIISIYEIMEKEINSRVDGCSQEVIIAQIELLLSYVNRFYHRQFITRKPANNTVLQNLEVLLNDYFNSDKPLHDGIPSVQYVSEQLNVSVGYLSDLLRTLMHQNTQQYIHQKLIEKAKEKLSTTHHTVGEIAYELGFEHPQSFNKLFKQKTLQTPLQFRATFSLG